MGLFSIWHWLIVLISFAPAIVGIVVMGWQHTKPLEFFLKICFLVVDTTGQI